jgi:site-specific DNA recombinase
MVKSKDQLGCAAHRDKGTCENNRTVRVADLERRIIEGIKRQFQSAEAITGYVDHYLTEHTKLQAEANRERIQVEKKIGALKRQIDNIVNTIADGVATSSMKSRLLELDPEKDRLEARLVEIEKSAKAVVLHPAAPDAYERKLKELEAAFRTEGNDRIEAAHHLRDMVQAIEVHPSEERGKYELRLVGKLAEILNMQHRKPDEPPRTVMVVAEEGLEPPTRGL